MKSSDFVARYLERRGVTHVFELVGGMITHMLDSLSLHTEINILSCHHEQAAAFAAEGYGRITGIPGVAMATSGPGATNLLTSLGSCFFDSVPAVFITGQVNTHELKGDRPIRQLGFQETDIVSMAKPICKLAIQVNKSSELPAALENAFDLALTGRQGPVLIDIPMNIQSEEIDDDEASKYLRVATNQPHHPLRHTENLEGAEPAHREALIDKLHALLDAIEHANKPLLLMGGGCASPRNRGPARKIINRLKIPTVFSLMAVDMLPESNPLRAGFIGSYGNRWANKALGAADLLIVIGSRLDIRQTGSDLESFCNGKKIWQIDTDAAEIGVRVQPDEAVICDIASIADLLDEIPDMQLTKTYDNWKDVIQALKEKFPANNEYQPQDGGTNPNQLIKTVCHLIDRPCQYITDVGQHQMWAAQSLAFKPEDRFLTSGGMGAMGFGLPAAIGASCAKPDHLTVLISGDGSFQLNIQELETLRRNGLDVKIILFNNRCHGMVRQFQESYFKDNLQSTVNGYSSPDFVAICSAYQIPAWRLEPEDSQLKALEWLMRQKGPALIEIDLSQKSKVFPKLAFGRKFGEMEPDAQPIAMEST
jgi:acetolactate synthase-1/2/3 large subunit